jgi:anti-anti-sigma factor
VAHDLVHFEVSRVGDHRILAVAGELDMATAPQLHEQLGADEPRHGLVLDLSAVSFMDSSALRVIFRPRTFRLVLVAPAGSAADRLIGLASLQQVLLVLTSVAEAVAHLDRLAGEPAPGA